MEGASTINLRCKNKYLWETRISRKVEFFVCLVYLCPNTFGIYRTKNLGITCGSRVDLVLGCRHDVNVSLSGIAIGGSGSLSSGLADLICGAHSAACSLRVTYLG